MTHFRQRGIALLVAIVMFALATTVAAAITYNKAMAARRAAATFTLEQALQAGMAAEALASIAIEAAADQTRTTLDQEWAQPLGPVEIEGTGIWIAAQLEDLEGRFNLNSVVSFNPQKKLFEADQHQVEVFRALLRSLDIEDRWADFLVDWIDPDIEPESQGGEDTLYLSQNPPYRPPNTYITHPSELLALPAFGPERYAKLQPYITALPASAKVNICTASGHVLDATRTDPSGGQSEFGQRDLTADREKGCFPTLNAYTDPIADGETKNRVMAKIEEQSRWFRLRTHIRIGTAEFVLYSVLYREESTNKVRALQRSFGSE